MPAADVPLPAPAQILSQLMPAPTPEESLDEDDMQLTKECSEIRTKLRQVKLSNQVGSMGGSKPVWPVCSH